MTLGENINLNKDDVKRKFSLLNNWIFFSPVAVWSPHGYLPSAPSQEGSGKTGSFKASFFLWTGQLNASHEPKGEYRTFCVNIRTFCVSAIHSCHVLTVHEWIHAREVNFADVKDLEARHFMI